MPEVVRYLPRLPSEQIQETGLHCVRRPVCQGNRGHPLASSAGDRKAPARRNDRPSSVLEEVDVDFQMSPDVQRVLSPVASQPHLPRGGPDIHAAISSVCTEHPATCPASVLLILTSFSNNIAYGRRVRALPFFYPYLLGESEFADRY